jgi:ABC-type multidrug transport system fused ATPase/permease subunit
MKSKNFLIAKSFKLISAKDKKSLMILTVSQILLSIMDILGVIAIGILAQMSIQKSLGSYEKSNFSSYLPGNSIKEESFFLILSIVLLLVGKTIFSFFLTRKMLLILSYRSSEISKTLVNQILSRPTFVLKNKIVQDVLYSTTRGVEYITLQVIAATLLIISDSAMLVLMTITFLIIDPIISIILVFIIFVSSLILYRRLFVNLGLIGEESARLNISGNQSLVEVLNLYRELFVNNSLNKFNANFSSTRDKLTRVNMELNFFPYFSKYFLESSFIVMTVFLGIFQYYVKDIESAVATIVLFLASGTRIAPAVLRIQQGAIQIRSIGGLASPTFTLIEELDKHQEYVYDSPAVKTNICVEFDGTVKITNLFYEIENEQFEIINDISLEIAKGQQIALVGPSGAGKSTLVDLILGLIIPKSGSIELSGLDPRDALICWPESIAYVPQNVFISNDTLESNIILGRSKVSESILNKAVDGAGLRLVVDKLPLGMKTLLGEGGVTLSGGEKQRIAIARALISSPKLIILDEATSALDGITEAIISDSIASLKGDVTVILIAHRLSTVREADKVAYLDAGRLRAFGTISQVRDLIPNFDVEARLMGL